MRYIFKLKLAGAILSLFNLCTLFATETAQEMNFNDPVEEEMYTFCINLQKQGITNTEILVPLRDSGNGFENYLKTVLSGMKKAQTANFKSTLLLSLSDDSIPGVDLQILDLATKYRHFGVTGIYLPENSD